MCNVILYLNCNDNNSILLDVYEMDKILFPVSLYVRILDPFCDTHNIPLDVYEMNKILFSISLYVRILNPFYDTHNILLDV